MTRVVIIDYGIGNVFSVAKAFAHEGGDVVLSSSLDEIANASHVVLPGVGAFADGMQKLEERGLVESVRAVAKSGKPLLGICLGMQLLMTDSTEFGLHPGLDIVPGRVDRIDTDLKIPHVGWNAIGVPDGGSWTGSMLAGLEAERPMFYFVHSYHATPASDAHRLAETWYGGSRVSAAIRRDNVFGVQFHPEEERSRRLARHPQLPRALVTRLRIGVLTTGRQDWGILRSTTLLLAKAPSMELVLFAGGMALSAEHGNIVQTIEAEGLVPAERLDWLASAPGSVHAEAAAALAMMGDALARQKPDALMLVGDRFETMSAAVAATVAGIPIVHIHGGEETEGAFDNALRHAITKLSHLHFVTHASYAARVVSLGEDPALVHIVGAPGLDNLLRPDLPTREMLEERLGMPLARPVVVVTLHPTTLGVAGAAELASMLAAMDAVDATYVITLPNNDPGATAIREALGAAATKPKRRAVEALGASYFGALMREADAMLGNSSSALLEAPGLALPAVNIGDRQKGRIRAPNLIDVAPDAAAVTQALQRAVDPSFRTAIGDASKRAFGDGHAAERILAVLERWTPPRPPVKRAIDVAI